ncbi:MAG: DUF1186 family protein [Desmonostoc vinosum HA7617-LM4]|jgi:hypothetical protein|nr:DUF1186 family protein [Desmonostoc vinosum HA7617-LM4]
MQIEEILSELENNTGKFPLVAIERAREERETITPRLLSILEELSNNLEELLEKSDYILHLCAFYLLAEFREPLAYPVIIKFFSVPGEIALDLTGDLVTEDLGRILASVSDGNIEPIKQLIDNKEVNEYVRGAALKSLLVLVAQDKIPRKQVIQYYKELFSNLGGEEDYHIWTSLVINSVELCAVELNEEINRVFEEDLIEQFFIDQEDVNDSFQQGIEPALNKLRENPRYSFIKDAISEMQEWTCFRPSGSRKEEFTTVFVHREGTSFSSSKKGKNQAKKKKMQEQSRRKNRSKKK